MSNQDEIAKLLAEANAQTEAAASEPPVTTEPVHAPAPAVTRKQPSRIVGRNSDVLGLAWLNGSLHAASFRRQKMTHNWSCPTAVRTVVDLEAVLDEALAQLEFAGTEMFLVLENELFLHQMEDIPLFSDAVQRTYLKNWIHRHEQQHGRVLWVMQPLQAARQEHALLLHLLPNSFYDELNRVLLKRHLDLTRILPLIVPLQYEINRIPAGKNSTAIVVAEIGGYTAVVAGRVGGALLMSRTILADLNREPERVAVEVNRSLLYTKQHFESASASIWLMAQNANASAEIQAKCRSAKKVVVLPATPVDWLQTAIRLSPKQPVNLLARYLKAKRRNRLIRGAFLAAGWLGLALMIFTAVNHAENWREERARLIGLKARETTLRAERDYFEHRNHTFEHNQAFIDRVMNDRLPPVPGHLLGFLAGVLPESARLSDFNVKWEPETGGWSFQISGTIEADEDTARGLITELQNQLAKSPLRARLNENVRVLTIMQANQTGSGEIQRFNLEGMLLEE